MTGFYLLLFAVRAAGFMSAIRFAVGIWKIQRISTNFKLILVAGFFAVIFLAQIYLDFLMALAISAIGFHLIGKIVVVGLQYLDQKKFQATYLQVIDLTVLRMQMGQSFRAALSKAIQDRGAVFIPKLIATYEKMIHLSEQDRKNTDEILLTALSEIDKTTNGALRKLEFYRSSLRFVEKIRQKSGQVTAQLRMQSILISLIYLFIFAMVWANWRAYLSIPLIFVSLALFLLGLVLVWTIGRRVKWSI